MGNGNIAPDGDLGQLTTKPTVAFDGVDPELYAQYRSAVDEFNLAVDTHANTVRDTEAAVAVLENWAAVGEKALQIVKPVLDQAIAAHQAQGPQAPKTHLIDRLFQVAQTVTGLALPRDPLGGLPTRV